MRTPTKNSPQTSIIRISAALFVCCLAIFGSLEAFADTQVKLCSSILNTDSEHNAGMDLVLNLIENSPADGPISPMHSWGFTLDPRFDNNIVTQIKEDAKPWEVGFKFLMSKPEFNQRFYKEHPDRHASIPSKSFYSPLNDRLKDMNIEDRVFVTWNELGRNSINLLIANNIALMGLTERPLLVDGLLMSPLYFGYHDLSGHSSLTLTYINSNFGFAREYSNIISQLNLTSDRRADNFSLGYNYFYWENKTLVRTLDEAIESKEIKSLKQLQEIFEDYSMEVEVIFDGQKLKSVTLLPSQIGRTNSATSRYMNMENLGENLPQSVRDQLTGDKKRDVEIVSTHLSLAFFELINEMYNHAAENLGFLQP